MPTHTGVFRGGSDGIVEASLCTSSLSVHSLPVAAVNSSATSHAVEQSFSEDLWVLDIGARFDMCPSNAFGIRIQRNDHCTIITAGGPAFLDRTVTTCIGAIGEKAECVPVEGLSVGLLSVGRRCRIHGNRFCKEPFATVPEFNSPEGAVLLVECYDDTYVPAIRLTDRYPTNDDDELR